MLSFAVYLHGQDTIDVTFSQIDYFVQTNKISGTVVAELSPKP